MPHRVLVIEDDVNIRGDIVTLLEEEGFIADALSDGALLMETISKTHFDVVLCDIMMPGKDGYELLRLLRKNLKPSDVPPFIFLTAKVDRNDLRKGMELGADDFITKPFRIQEIVKAIHTQINKRFELVAGGHKLDETLVKNLEEKIESASNVENLSYSGSLFIDTNSRTIMLRIQDISYISAESDYTFVHASDGQQFDLRKTMETWVKMLPSEQFLRIHRGIIINVEYIRKIEKWFNYTYRVYLRSVNEPFTISQRISRDLRNKIK